MIQLTMKTVGLTGGIGSGKTTLALWFAENGIPVYNSDLRAMKLMNDDREVIGKITDLFGEEAYINGAYNRKYIASRVFGHKELLQKLNAIVHPAVFADFDRWKLQFSVPFIIKEAAILFESGAYKDCDAIILVTADEDIRIRRVMERDGVSESRVRKIMNSQWPEKEKLEKSDYVIFNNSDLEHLKNEFHRVHKKLLRRFSEN